MGLVNGGDMKKIALFLLLTLAPGLEAWAGRSIGFSISDSLEAAKDDDLKVTVYDEITGLPIEGAVVTVEEEWAFGSSATASRETTNSEGSATFIMVFKEQGKLVHRGVSVEMAGYAGVSVVGLQSNEAQFFLRPSGEAREEAIVSGAFTGWLPFVPSTNLVRAGLVFQSASALDLLYFNAGSFISPLYDEIDVFGRHRVPSNLVIPKQDIFLPIGSVTLHKPLYRLPVPAGVTTRFAGVQGEIAVSALLPALGGGRMTVDLLNRLKFTRVGRSDSFTPRGDMKKDFEATVNLTPRHEVTVRIPPFDGNVLAVALTDVTGDRQELLPTDVKVGYNSENPGRVTKVQLAAPVGANGANQDVVILAIGQKGTRITGQIVDRAPSRVVTGEYLMTPEARNIQALPEELNLSAVSRGIGALIFERAIGEQVSSSPRSGVEQVWTVFVLPAAGAIRVPTAPIRGALQKGRYSQVQLEFGSSFNERSIDGAKILGELERFTRTTNGVGLNQNGEL